LAPATRLVGLRVVENATQKNVTGPKNWAALKREKLYVVIEATTAPQNAIDEWKQINWSGDKGDTVEGKPNRRKLSLRVSRTHHVQAELGGVSDTLDLWVLWATVEIMIKDLRPKGAAPFDRNTRDNSDKLGEVTYKSLSSSVIDEAAGVFVENMGASGKVAPVATLSPKGVAKVVQAGWAFKREVMSRIWIDGHKLEDKKTGTPTWVDDTSGPAYQRLIPDDLDKIYDLDAPDLRWGQSSYETYNNFRQWIEWNGERCSDNALWSWQARWLVNRDISKQITLNDVRKGNITLRDKPYYPHAKSR